MNTLPPEIIDLIVSFYSSPALLYIPVFHESVKRVLYSTPDIKRIDRFRGSNHVRKLDLRRVYYTSRGIGRILRQCPLLHTFIAPVKGFTAVVYASLKRCRVHTLDVSANSEHTKIDSFLSLVSAIKTLKRVTFPRFTTGDGTVTWPALEYVGLSGSITDGLLQRHPLPAIQELRLHSVALSTYGVSSLLSSVGNQLQSLEVMYPMDIANDALTMVLTQCPVLKYLRCSVEYITRDFLLSPPHPLRELQLDAAGGLLRAENKITPDDVSMAILGPLEHLRIVRYGISLNWSSRRDNRDLADLLEDNGGYLHCLQYS